jgi:hypothetical protein
VIYLIGCDHCKAQTYAEGSGLDDPQNKTQREFRRMLIKAIGDYDPDLIAEEHHPDLLKTKGERSVALEVASEYRICHRFCDPSQSERLKLGIGNALPHIDPAASSDWYKRIGTEYDAHRHDIAHRWPIREGFWISQLRDDIYKTVVFICGTLHTYTFKERLESSGVKSQVIKDSVGCVPTLGDSDAYKALQDVRVNDFPPVTDRSDSRCFCISFPTQIQLNL